MTLERDGHPVHNDNCSPRYESEFRLSPAIWTEKKTTSALRVCCEASE